MELWLFVIAGVAGATAEAIMIFNGAWTYTNYTFFGVPVWLPLLWGTAALFISRFAEYIKKAIK